MSSIGAGDAIVRAKRTVGTDGDRFLAVAKVGGAVQQTLGIEILTSQLEVADQEHLPIQLEMGCDLQSLGRALRHV